MTRGDRGLGLALPVGLSPLHSPGAADGDRRGIEPSGQEAEGLGAPEREQWATDVLSSWVEQGRKGRLALNWLPIFRWPLQRVWPGPLGGPQNGNALPI